MNIVSLNFALFVAATLALVILAPKRGQNLALLAASLFFYATWSWFFVAILLAVTAFNFAAGMWFEREPAERKGWLWAAIIVNVLALLAFKFFDSSYAYQLAFPMRAETVGNQDWIRQVLLPVGFSFYILQAISYLADVLGRRLPASRSFVEFALYMAYFPKLLSGPIERARTFLPKLQKERLVDNDLLGKAFTLILTGLFRKLVIADLLNGIQGHFARGAPGWEGLLNLLVFGLYLYNDFAGYTGIIRGVSCLFGIELSPNFMQPFLSRSFSEFWTRWHISLSEWLRDYIFFPLSRWLLSKNRNQRNAFNTYFPQVATMLVSGLWHGLNPAMLLWGGLHGLYLIIERFILLHWPGFHPAEGSRIKQLTSGAVVFALVTLAWAPFKFGGLREALAFWMNLWAINLQPIPPSVIAQILLLAGLSFGLDFIQYHHKDEAAFLKWSLWPRTAATAFAIICLIVCAFWNMNIPSPVFVYQGF